MNGELIRNSYKFFYSGFFLSFHSKGILKCQLAVFLACLIDSISICVGRFFVALYSFKALPFHRTTQSFRVKEKIKCELKNKLKVLRNFCQKHILYMRKYLILFIERTFIMQFVKSKKIASKKTTLTSNKNRAHQGTTEQFVFVRMRYRNHRKHMRLQFVSSLLFLVCHRLNAKKYMIYSSCCAYINTSCR